MNKPTQPYQQGKFDTAAIAGSDLYSSIDIDLQNLGEKLLKGKMGSVVAIDPRTGGILAMVSAPGYDPNLLTGSQRRRQFSEMFLDPRKPMLNRAITGEYSPGSTFKTLQGLVALQEGVITTDYGYPCRGGYYACGRRMGCHGAGHAPNLERAIAVSCNAYFADVFRKIVDNPKYPNVDTGLAVWDRYMYSFGLGHPLGIDIPGERRGNIPTPKYYQKIFGPKWNSCNVVSISIGQGEVLSTVTQLSNAIAMIANKGWYYTPHVVDSIAGGDRFGLLKPFQTRIEALNIPDSMFESVHSGMEDVMKPGGTGWRLAVDGIRICGKTGTVENYYKGKKQKDHSFFAAFAPRENPQIAIACIVENAGFGATVAGPVVSLMIEQYMHDSISAKRQSWIERYSSMTIIPPRINDEIQLRDSINREKDRVKAQKKLMDEIKREAGLEEDPDAEIINRKQPEKPASDTGKNKQQGLPATVPAYLLLAGATATRRRPNQQNRRTP
jgi:penicillin-binding protein 2